MSKLLIIILCGALGLTWLTLDIYSVFRLLGFMTVAFLLGSSFSLGWNLLKERV